jgi:alpha-tubulin suppressor-like RCC1 family protein
MGSTRVIGGAAVVFALLLAACGGDDGGDDDGSPTTEQTTTTESDDSPTTTTAEEPGFEASVIAAGDQHACALDPDGRAYCWGYNRMGQLGDGTGEDSRSPVAVAGDLQFTTLSAGRYFTCGISTDGATWCWGENAFGQLGDGTSGEGGDDQNRLEPVEVLGDLTFAELVTGQVHVCGRTDAGEAWCWGAYASGQLGNDARPEQTQPSRSAADLGLDSLAAGGTSSCGLPADGVAWCWGNNTFGQLGDGTVTNAAQHEPRAVTGPVRFTALTMGRAHACGLDADGAAWCWGGNSYGQLGDESTDDRLTPTAVTGDHQFVSLTSGLDHTCGLDTDGAAWCWGANTVGQLGDGTGADSEDRTSPVAVVGDLSFTELSAGEEFTCGLADDGGAWCWGSGGVNGDGTIDTSTEPVPVAAI